MLSLAPLASSSSSGAFSQNKSDIVNGHLNLNSQLNLKKWMTKWKIQKMAPSLLPEKKMKFPQESESSCGICRIKPIEDIPEDIMDAAR